MFHQEQGDDAQDHGHDGGRPQAPQGSATPDGLTRGRWGAIGVAPGWAVWEAMVDPD